jgi:hypothetical protein
MDLGAFLRPGADLAVALAPAEGGGGSVQGRVARREGPPRWVGPTPQPTGRKLTLTLDLPGFSLDEGGSLRPAGPETSARVVLLGEVRGCRFWPPRELYVLRLSLLGRVWP